MNLLNGLAVVTVGVGAAGVAATLVRPTARLAPRVRPYTLVTRAQLGRSADVLATAAPSGGTLRRLFGPPVIAAMRRLSRSIESRGDEQLALRLRHAGLVDISPEEFRLRQAGQAAMFAVGGLAVGMLVLRTPLAALALGGCGLVLGVTRGRGRIDHEIDQRRTRLRAELYTVNQLLALHIRTGAGPVQAVQRIVDRGSGVAVEELSETLVWMRSGLGEAEAFQRIADLTPEPSAARTYRLLAAGAERGSDLAVALLALSEDIRDARREALRKTATKRRAAMLAPTIAILAPIMLLFIAAPIPSIIFGSQ